jgi:two-component system chemotaxis response regulator CheB
MARSALRANSASLVPVAMNVEALCETLASSRACKEWLLPIIWPHEGIEPAMTQTPPLIAIGASLGALGALRAIVSGLPADLPASVLIVTHTGAYPSVLPQLLSAPHGAMAVKHAEHAEILQPGCIYVAPPDHHMTIEGARIELNRGPKEHHTRPAVDPLFRTAALWHGPRVVGVVLTGNMDDGTAGLQAIKSLGGMAIVQDPQEAEAPSMPRSALRYVTVDHCVRVAEMPALLADLMRGMAADNSEEASTALSQSQVLERQNARARLDDEVLASKGNAMERLPAFAEPSPFTCPDCGGGLWEVKGALPQRYRCHTGHGFSLLSLGAAQAQVVEEAIWSAIRALQEKEALLRRLAQSESPDEDAVAGQSSQEAARQARQQADILRQLVQQEGAGAIAEE